MYTFFYRIANFFIKKALLNKGFCIFALAGCLEVFFLFCVGCDRSKKHTVKQARDYADEGYKQNENCGTHAAWDFPKKYVYETHLGSDVTKGENED